MRAASWSVVRGHLGRFGPSAPGYWAAATLLVSAGAAFGQNYRGESGTRLDRNQRVGSGGINAPGVDIRDRIWMNNQIITSGAPAGRSFRGYVGYTAADEFRGIAGSNANYDFRRDSASSARVASGVRASDALRYQLSITTGQTVPGYMSASIVTARDANAASSGIALGSSAALRSTSDYVSARALRPSVVSTRTDKEGREWNATASPLTGLNWLRVEKDPTAAGSKSEEPEQPRSEFAVPSVEEQKKKELERLARYTMTPTGLENYSPLMRLRMQQAGDAASKPAAPGNLAVTENQAERSATRVVEHDRFIASVRGAYKPGQAEKPATEPTLPDQVASSDKPRSAMEIELDRISRVLRGLPAIEPKPREDLSPGGANPFAPTSPTPKPAAEQPKPERPDDRDAERKKPLPPDIISALRAAGVKNIESLAPAADSTDPEWYRLQMQSGQKALEDQRYFDAEDRFTRAIAAMPNDPMAKAGRIHAELGASLFLSASANLRALIQSHPEMVGARFDAKLRPSSDRTREIAEMLRGTIEKGGGLAMVSDAGLLLAYTGRISGDQAMCREGLDVFARNIEPDNTADKTLDALLRGVWLAEPTE